MADALRGDSDLRDRLRLAVLSAGQVRHGRRVSTGSTRRPPDVAGGTRALIDEITEEYISHWMSNPIVRSDGLLPKQTQAWAVLIHLGVKAPLHETMSERLGPLALLTSKAQFTGRFQRDSLRLLESLAIAGVGRASTVPWLVAQLTRSGPIPKFMCLDSISAIASAAHKASTHAGAALAQSLVEPLVSQVAIQTDASDRYGIHRTSIISCLGTLATVGGTAQAGDIADVLLDRWMSERDEASVRQQIAATLAVCASVVAPSKAVQIADGLLASFSSATTRDPVFAGSIAHSLASLASVIGGPQADSIVNLLLAQLRIDASEHDRLGYVRRSIAGSLEALAPRIGAAEAGAIAQTLLDDLADWTTYDHGTIVRTLVRLASVADAAQSEAIAKALLDRFAEEMRNEYPNEDVCQGISEALASMVSVANKVVANKIADSLLNHLPRSTGDSLFDTRAGKSIAVALGTAASTVDAAKARQVADVLLASFAEKCDLPAGFHRRGLAAALVAAASATDRATTDRIVSVLLSQLAAETDASDPSGLSREGIALSLRTLASSVDAGVASEIAESLLDWLARGDGYLWQVKTRRDCLEALKAIALKGIRSKDIVRTFLEHDFTGDWLPNTLADVSNVRWRWELGEPRWVELDRDLAS